jgi:hypothetical protein
LFFSKSGTSISASVFGTHQKGCAITSFIQGKFTSVFSATASTALSHKSFAVFAIVQVIAIIF